MILICLGINPVGDCSEMAVLGFRSSLLVIIIIIIIIIITHALIDLAVVNCCSITNKQVELEQFLTSHQVDIFLGTESHLDNSMFNAEIFLKHYNVYRNDRNKYEGGVFIVIKDSIPSSQPEIISPNEILWVQLHIGNN